MVHSGNTGGTAVTQKTALITPSTSPWTHAAVNGLVARLGYSSDSTPNPIWDSLLLEYAVP